MPAYRRKNRCAYAAEPKPKPKPKAPRAPRKKLSDEEKKERKDLRENTKAWKESLTPWTVDDCLRLPVGTMAMFKSDAKHAYGLTEQEIMTLPHESIACSHKTYFDCAVCGELALQKAKFFDSEVVIPPADPTKPVSRGLMNPPRRLFKKSTDNGRRQKGNYSSQTVLIQLLKETKDHTFAAMFGGAMMI